MVSGGGTLTSSLLLLTMPCKQEYVPFPEPLPLLGKAFQRRVKGAGGQQATRNPKPYSLKPKALRTEPY